MKDNKVVVILGPTSSGKTSLGVKLAHKFNGEIISADSRQVYREMDIGTGKDLSDFSFKDDAGKQVTIAHHLIDVVNPDESFDIVQWNKLARIAIEDILKRKKLPIIVGGTGLYLQSLVDNFDFSKAGSNKKLREEFEEKDSEELLNILKNLNEKFAKELDENDYGNKRRLIRYIEILKNDKNFTIKKSLKEKSNFDYLLLGVSVEREELNKKIHNRLLHRFDKEGMLDEVRALYAKGVTRERLEGFGLEYKHISWYLNGKIEYDEMKEKLFIAIRQFAKRQMTWFRRWEKQGAEIKWVDDVKKASEMIGNFLDK